MRRALAHAVVIAASVAVATLPATGATSSTVVGAVVPSATHVEPVACASNEAGRTSFGAVQPGAAVVTSLDCDVEFGSSNATSSLRVRQSDQHGRAMFAYGTGAADAAFDGVSSGNGIVSFDTQAGDDVFDTVAPRPGGGLVAVGSSSDGSDADVLVVALLENGSPDPAFGDGDGIEVVGLSATGTDNAQGVAVQPDGRIVVVGAASNGSNLDAVVLRLEADGDLDPTFSGDGIVTFAPSTAADELRDVVLAANGDIVAAGKTRNGNDDGLVVRVRDDGTPRSSFDGDGVLVLDGGGWEAFQGVLVAPDGDIVAAGNTQFGTQEHLVVRMSATGVLDPAFDGDTSTPTYPGNGYARYNLSATGLDIGEGIGTDAQGRILVPGRTDLGAGEDASIMRVDGTTGALDDSFDGDGSRIVPAYASGTDRAYGAVLVQGDGKVLLAGHRNAVDPDGWVRRLRDDGSDDTSFGASGLYVFDQSADDRLSTVVETWDGRVLAVGRLDSGGFDRAAVLRLAGGADVLDYQTGVDDWTAESTSMFGACLASVTGGSPTWASDGTCNVASSSEWRAVTAAGTVAATAASGIDTAVAHLRFGFRVGSQQAPADYVAPITFEVTAP